MPKTHVVIVTYNGIKWIKNCLESVLNSTIPLTLIVIDNCSTDTTANFIKINFPDIILLMQKKNLGFGIANNIGISYAIKDNSEYVFLLNQDAYVEPDTIEKLIEAARQNPEYGIISPIHTNGNATELDESFLYYINNSFCPKFVSDFVLDKVKKNIYSLSMINAAAWLLPKTTLDIVGGFDPMFFLYGEDDNYCQRVLYHKLLIGIIPSVFIKHDSENNNSKEVIKGSENYYDKFLNSIKVTYGNVNNDRFKEVGNLKVFFFKQSVYCLLQFNIKNFKVNWKKRIKISGINLENSVVLNRKKGRNYL
jgi:GT2 family glycosyltransferase